MNERILKLANEARTYAETKPHIYQVAYDKKFAELVVRECAKFTDSKLVFDNDSGECLNWVEGSNLLEHFGVEE